MKTYKVEFVVKSNIHSITKRKKSLFQCTQKSIVECVSSKYGRGSRSTSVTESMLERACEDMGERVGEGCGDGVVDATKME